MCSIAALLLQEVHTFWNKVLVFRYVGGFIIEIVKFDCLTGLRLMHSVHSLLAVATEEHMGGTSRSLVFHGSSS